jgi:hypothetical protein
MSNKKAWIIVIVSVAAFCLCTASMLAVTGLVAWRTAANQGEDMVRPGLEEEAPVPQQQDGGAAVPALPEITPAPASSGAFQTLANLREAEVPINDPLNLAERLLGLPDISPTVAPSGPFQPGDRQTFWASNTDTNETFRVNAVLRAEVDSAYFWVEDGVEYRQSDLDRLARTFNDEIYPTNRAFFGSEWSPGIDGDTHLYILYAHNLGESTAAYFSSIDSVNPLAHSYSNAHEMFMINADTVSLGEEYTYGVLAHEFQHMIHWNNDRNEDSWVNEGFSELASFLNGYDPGGFDTLFAEEPDMQLTDWPQEADARRANYGSSFLFMAYFLDRYGEQATQALVSHPDNSMDSVDAVLTDLAGQGLLDAQPATADDLFVDWTVANYLADPAIADGRYAYQRYEWLPEFTPAETVDDCSGAWQTRTVSQYGTDYIELDCSGIVDLTFQGASEVGVLSQGANSGDFAFWSNASDESNTSLQQTFDFRGIKAPITLEYSVWYNLEQDYDYLYLTASTDGETWQILETPSCTTDNPSGNSYGCGYNGRSGGYRHEVVDLSDYAGQQVTLRFDYVTDAAITGEGLLLDDVSIPAIGYASDFEQDDGGWQAQGFVRIENRLPQTFRLTVIQDGRQPEVRTIEVDDLGRATVTIDDPRANQVTVVVSGTTRFTRQKAAYSFSVSQTP